MSDTSSADEATPVGQVPTEQVPAPTSTADTQGDDAGSPGADDAVRDRIAELEAEAEKLRRDLEEQTKQIQMSALVSSIADESNIPLPAAKVLLTATSEDGLREQAKAIVGMLGKRGAPVVQSVGQTPGAGAVDSKRAAVRKLFSNNN